MTRSTQHVVILLALFALGVVLVERTIVYVRQLELPNSQFGLLSASYKTGTLLFVPDIMLGRAVEDIMHEHGGEYPFLGTRAFVQSHDIALANFEASVPVKHEKTPLNTMRFSVEKQALGVLKDTGFDVLSLANNHALDFGESGLENTKSRCDEIGLSCVGHPKVINHDSVKTFPIGDATISVLMLHNVFTVLSTTTLSSVLLSMRNTSDVQFVFVHWGDEYATVHSKEQKELAHFLIDNGADAIVGHHPHVIEDIEEYRGKPIFYSLGNFVFDQYFSDEVQVGYMVSVLISKKELTYTLTPYNSLRVRSQPELEEGSPRAATVSKLLTKEYFTDEEIVSGSISYTRD